MKDEEFDEFLNSPELQDVLTDLDIEPEEVTRDNFLKKLDEKRPRKEYGFKKIEATRPAVEEEDVPFSVEWGAFVDGRRFTIEGNIHATDEMEACDYVLRGFLQFSRREMELYDTAAWDPQRAFFVSRPGSEEEEVISWELVWEDVFGADGRTEEPQNVKMEKVPL